MCVEDVVMVMHLLMKSDITGERFTVISENITFKELIFWIANGLKIKKPTMLAKPWMTSIAWRLDWFFQQFFSKRKFSRATAKSLHTTAIYSNEKIKNRLNFEFQPIKKLLKRLLLLIQKLFSFFFYSLFQ
ncbi:Rossmann-fold NAD(P)-binding domain-containing protein [Flavobacterium piscinae]|uniref:hypothetical protein n=1 Tax=Flavobacterium piscinae TaxID=2506424 RepID=UPI002AAB1697|nr:hypothetical protein [Flavobacterium piscinae]